jgi:hypothetical protein
MYVNVCALYIFGEASLYPAGGEEGGLTTARCIPGSIGYRPPPAIFRRTNFTDCRIYGPSAARHVAGRGQNMFGKHKVIAYLLGVYSSRQAES